MQRLLEILLGLEKGFLSQQGDFSLNFNQQWPAQAINGAAMWNVLLGIAALVLTAMASVLYLFQERELKAKKPRKFYYRLPALGTLDDLISKSMALGFVLMTMGVIAGSTWAFVEWKTDWIAQPKIAISFFTWGIYMALVFLRTTAGWRGRKAAVMTVTVLGFSAITWAAHARLGAIFLKQ